MQNQCHNPNFLKKDEDMEIKILGPGCKRCHQAEQNVRDVVAEEQLDATIVKVTDPLKIAAHGVFGTPSVVIDGKVKCTGKVPDKAQIKAWLENQS
jgi:small redox-active disulfide protein 2